MPRGSRFVLGRAVTAPPARDGPDGIADSDPQAAVRGMR
jgi:hypothetical protein